MDWSALGRILIMSKQGCVAKFLKFQRFYTWDELAIKRYENYRYMLGNGSKYCPAPYKKGVFFSRRKVRKWKKERRVHTVAFVDHGVPFL